MNESPTLELEVIDGGSARRGAREAVVSAVLGARSVRVEADGASFDAVVATVGDYRPAAGDRVLVLREEAGAWVLGVIGSVRPVIAASAIRTSDGVRARVTDDGRAMTVESSRGQVLFRHDARTGESTVVGPSLRIRAESDLSLEASRRVRIEAPQVELGASEQESLTIAEGGTELRSSRLRAIVEEARFSVTQGVIAAERIESAVHKARTFVDVMELRAGRIVERAKESFREVEGVSQTRAGRIRTVAKAAYQVLAERATIKAEDDLELMGEKIHLA